MYADPRYGSSQFRRPWSPEPFESRNIGQTMDDSYAPALPGRHQPEGSGTSVEALDLADYSRALGAARNDGPYPPFPDYPPISSHRPLADPSTPSLTSRATLSTHGHSVSSQNRPQRQSLGSHRSSPLLHEPRIQSHNPEIDITHFPSWSRNWYTPDSMRSSHPDLDYPPPVSHFNSNKKSPFDPTYLYNDSDPFTFNPHGYLPASSLGHESNRELLPWGGDLSSTEHPLNPAVKEERIRMLEREFGHNTKIRPGSDGNNFVDAEGKPLIGTVDKNGNLVTVGPKKRVATRALQIILALGASVPSIYAAAAIKSKDPAPPANKPPAYVLYALSVITLVILLYMFVFRPCCCAGRRRSASQDPISNGMMVLPIQGIPGGKKGRKNGKSAKGNNRSNDIQVNLIVDPDVLKGRDEETSDDEEEGLWEGSNRSSRKKRRPRRRGVFAGLAMEEDWKRARGWLKKITFVDVLGMILWGGAFIYILIGKRCPSGGFEGWCNAYNTSTAAACLLCVAFGLSIFFDVKDLHSSKASPRTRP